MDADYVVVGAGSAGCVVASRLSENGAQGDAAGGRAARLASDDPHSGRRFEAAAPSAGQLELLAPSRRRAPAAAPMHWPRGKVLGGTSSINGMLYVRGNPADYDGWAQMGCRGWSYDDVLPYFRKSEHYVQGGDPEYRGKGGPLLVEDYRTILPLTHRFVEAAQQAGFPFTRDLQRRRAGRRRLFADDAAGTVARLDRAHLSGRGAAARRICGSRPTRSRRGCCSTAGAASASRFARAAVIARRARRAR